MLLSSLAGAAGIGTLLSLTDNDLFGLDPDRVLLLERGEAIGSSFRMWPKEMRFISPSFNQAGWTNSFDLNAVAYGSSPAYTLHAQHPSGSQYADYLDELAKLARVRDRVQLLRWTGSYPEMAALTSTCASKQAMECRGKRRFARGTSCGQPASSSTRARPPTRG